MGVTTIPTAPISTDYGWDAEAYLVSSSPMATVSVRQPVRRDTRQHSIRPRPIPARTTIYRSDSDSRSVFSSIPAPQDPSIRLKITPGLLDSTGSSSTYLAPGYSTNRSSSEPIGIHSSPRNLVNVKNSFAALADMSHED